MNVDSVSGDLHEMSTCPEVIRSSSLVEFLFSEMESLDSPRDMVLTRDGHFLRTRNLDFLLTLTFGLGGSGILSSQLQLICLVMTLRDGFHLFLRRSSDNDPVDGLTLLLSDDPYSEHLSVVGVPAFCFGLKGGKATLCWLIGGSEHSASELTGILSPA